MHKDRREEKRRDEIRQAGTRKHKLRQNEKR